MSEKNVQAWFGGTFDPVHNGHLVAAQALVEQLHLRQLNITPCYLSPLKQQVASSQQDRINMLQLAIAGHAAFRLDTREIERGGQSRTVETLTGLRAEQGDDACLVWAIGWDAFISLPQWYKWQSLFEYSNIVVVNRPGFSVQVDETLAHFCEGREVVLEELHNFNFGKLVFLNTPLLEIASSEIRARCKRKQAIHFMLPPSVEDYIQKHALYQ